MKKALIICFLLALSVFTCKKDKLTFSNAQYAVGVIDFYKSAYNSQSRISFTYVVNNKPYSYSYDNKQNGWSVPATGNFPNNAKYMIQFDAGNPKVARFLFDYPVNTPADSANYVNQFKTHPPSCCLVYTCRGILNYW